jgi:hypothetical protein
VESTPDIDGPHGRAWKINLDRVRILFAPKSKDGSVVSWIVDCPWAHPGWRYYLFSLIHLRPLGDARDESMTIYLEGATHEIILSAIDPRMKIARAIEGVEFPALLTPTNFAAQFIEPSDEAAAARVEITVREICDGKLSPDTDFTYGWIKRYGDNMVLDRSLAVVPGAS